MVEFLPFGIRMTFMSSLGETAREVVSAPGP
jgi:hypothetical protein